MTTIGYCWARIDGYGCTLPKNHEGGFHQAFGKPIVSWPTDNQLAKIRESVEAGRDGKLTPDEVAEIVERGRCPDCQHLVVLHGYDRDCGWDWCEVDGCKCESDQ